MRDRRAIQPQRTQAASLSQEEKLTHARRGEETNPRRRSTR